MIRLIGLVAAFLLVSAGAFAQTGPSPSELAAYQALHAAAASGDVAKIRQLAGSADLNSRDSNGRTPLMVAAFQRHHEAARALIAAGADLNLLDKDRYDLLTISGVIDDPVMVKIALDGGANAKLITSRYDGTALIASAHLGHVEVVRHLIAGKAPLDHINNLGWTALIEAIVLGDGGAAHQAIVKDLIAAGADVNIADRNSMTPMQLAQRSGYAEMVKMLKAAGGN